MEEKKQHEGKRAPRPKEKGFQGVLVNTRFSSRKNSRQGKHEEKKTTREKNNPRRGGEIDSFCSAW